MFIKIITKINMTGKCPRLQYHQIFHPRQCKIIYFNFSASAHKPCGILLHPPLRHHNNFHSGFCPLKLIYNSVAQPAQLYFKQIG